jgi:ribonucleotide reductase alpha subunit
MLRGIAENAFLSKWAGGLGGSWTAVRGTGAYIGGTNGESQGVIPFLKLHNDQLVAVNQGGKRKGSGCAYLETWHNDILEFLELRKNTGDDRRRTHDMNTANWIPDLFMKRMEARQIWTLFRSNETPISTSSTAALRGSLHPLRAARRGGQGPRPEDRGPRALEEDALDALRDRPPLDHLQGCLQRPLPPGPRRRHPLVQSLHRDHPQHLERRDRRLQPRLRHP